MAKKVVTTYMIKFFFGICHLKKNIQIILRHNNMSLIVKEIWLVFVVCWYRELDYVFS